MNNYYFLIKRLIFLILLYLTYSISKISLIFNIPYLTYLSWLISLRKIRSSNNSFKKIKVLILEKSFGVDDIKGITKKKLDLRDTKKVLDFFRRIKFDYVYLCAAKVGGIMANVKYPKDFICDNLEITLNITKACHETKVKKLLFCKF